MIVDLDHMDVVRRFLNAGHVAKILGLGNGHDGTIAHDTAVPHDHMMAFVRFCAENGLDLPNGALYVWAYPEYGPGSVLGIPVPLDAHTAIALYAFARAR